MQLGCPYISRGVNFLFWIMRTVRTTGQRKRYNGKRKISRKFADVENRRAVMLQKRVKSGLAVTEQHLKLMDENLRRAKANSRNDFVEQAIEFYIGYLNSEDSSEYIGELLSAELDRRLSPFAKTFSTNQYKTSVQLAIISHILATAFEFTHEYVDDLFHKCQAEVKRLDSVPSFARICEDESSYRRQEVQ